MDRGINDTIAAAATAPGEAGIGIIRISGNTALAVADEMFVCASGKRPSACRSHTLHYGWVRAAGGNDGGESLDEGLLTVMRAPKTYTREDVAEINCHGGILAMRRVLERALECGCRLAEPGEFTRRAFLNGRIDLSQAEAVLDVIRAKTDAALSAGIGQLKGSLSTRLRRLREGLLESLAGLEAAVDFPGEDTGGLAGTPAVLRTVESCLGQVSEMIAGCERGKTLREGIRAVICGKPNVGKSSLLNALLNEERSLVTPVAGTTRDTIEEIIDIRGIPVRIIDTAGILEPRDLVERKALARTRKSIREADLVILVFDSSKPLDSGDRTLMRRLSGARVVPVMNKIDLKQKADIEFVRRRMGEPVRVCARSGRNLGRLEDAIERAVCPAADGAGELFSGSVFLADQRRTQALKKVKKLLEEAADSLHNELPPEVCAQSVREACLFLEELTGLRFSEGMLDRIFSRFCIGK